MKKERPYINGLCYVYKYARNEIPMEKAAELFKRMNAKSMRSWNHALWLLENPRKVNKEEAENFHKMYRSFQQAGAKQIIGMSHKWFMPENLPADAGDIYCVPDRDLSKGSDYMNFLDIYEESWETLAKEFGEINYWETGNEYNHDPFLHPMNYREDKEKNVFTLEEKAEITTDMMFRSARGIKKANPEAKIIMPGMAPVGDTGISVFKNSILTKYSGMAKTLDCIYENIKSGEFGSTNPRDFFDSLCWHPYYSKKLPEGGWEWRLPDDSWVENNDTVYRVALKHGDDEVDCYLTEFGFSDFGSPETDEKVMDYYGMAYENIREKMPYVSGAHTYRMFEFLRTDERIDYWGLFHKEGDVLIPEKRAYGLQKAFGGNDPLEISLK